jgi:TPR repeat protein
VAKDEKKAFEWYTKSAEQGDAFAQGGLGRCYANGTGVHKDEKEAVKWYTKSAEQADSYGQRLLAWCYANGKGVTQDYKEAVKWLTKSAEQGNALAQGSLGWCYANGKGVTKDEKEAVKWYTKSAETGDVYAQNNLSWVLSTSSDSNIRKGKEAEKWAQKVIATRGLTDAFCLDTLAAAYAEQGDFASAVSTQEKAILLLKDTTRNNDFQAHLKSYQAKKPWRELGNPEKKP